MYLQCKYSSHKPGGQSAWAGIHGGGISGRFFAADLIVDLTTSQMRDEPLNMAYARRFVGNSGREVPYMRARARRDSLGWRSLVTTP